MIKIHLTPYGTEIIVRGKGILDPYKGGETMEILVIAAAFGLLDSLAAGLGADSRDGDDWFKHGRV